MNKIKETIDDITLKIKKIKSPKKIKKRRRKSNIKVNQKKPILNLKKIKSRELKIRIILDNFQNESNLPKKTEDISFPPIKKKNKIKKVIHNNINIININNNIFSPRSECKIISMNKNDNFQKPKEILAYNEGELNDMDYESALKYDERSYLEYYFSLIKTKHDLIFTFFYNKDYNSKIIKIDLFFVNFVMNYTINALFFSDDTMHKIYEEKGKFQLLYQLPQIIYSSIIFSVLTALLQLLALSEEGILDFKHNKNVDNIDKRKIELNNILKTKLILFFIISTIFFLIFWYYLSMFCATYVNTQIHLIKDTLISFGMSLLYPFGIYLLPGIFRIHALLNRNKNSKKNEAGKYIYNLGKILQIL